MYGQREPPQVVVAADDVGQRPDEVEGGVVAEVAEPADTVAAGADMDLQRPAGGERNGGDEVLVGVDDPLAAEVFGDEPAAEAVAVDRRWRSWAASLVAVTGGRWP